jgi:hypothetical protein
VRCFALEHDAGKDWPKSTTGATPAGAASASRVIAGIRPGTRIEDLWKRCGVMSRQKRCLKIQAERQKDAPGAFMVRLG